MTQGPVEETVLRQAYRRGGTPPDAMANAPELRPELQPFWTAYERLSTCRQFVGMAGAPGPIPWTAIAEYAREHRFRGQDYHDLVTIVTMVDEAYRVQAMKAMKNNGKPGGVSAPDGGDGGKGR